MADLQMRDLGSKLQYVVWYGGRTIPMVKDIAMEHIEKSAIKEQLDMIERKKKQDVNRGTESSSSLASVWQFMMNRLAIIACKYWTMDLANSGSMPKEKLTSFISNVIERSSFTCFEIYKNRADYLPGRFSLAPIAECEMRRLTLFFNQKMKTPKQSTDTGETTQQQHSDPCYIFLCCLVHHVEGKNRDFVFSPDRKFTWKHTNLLQQTVTVTSNLYLLGFVRADHLCIKLASWAETHMQDGEQWKNQLEHDSGVHIEERSLMVPLDVFSLDAEDIMVDRQNTLARRARQMAKKMMVSHKNVQDKEPSIDSQTSSSQTVDYTSDYDVDDELIVCAPALLSRVSTENAIVGRVGGNAWSTSIYVPHWDPPVSDQDINALARNQGFSLGETARELVCILKKCHYSYFAEDQLPRTLVREWMNCASTNMSPYNRNRYTAWLLIHVFCHAEELTDFYVKAYEVLLRCQLAELKEPSEKVALVTVNRLKIDLTNMGDNYTFEDQVCTIATTNLSRMLHYAAEWHKEGQQTEQEDMKPAMLNLLVTLTDLVREYKVTKKGAGGRLHIVREVQSIPSPPKTTTQTTNTVKKKKK